MRAWFGSGVAATVLIVSMALAGAEQNPTGHQEKTEKAQQNERGRAGAEEPSSQTPSRDPTDSAAFINGRLAAPGAPPDGQTVPAKFSERNSRLDALPSMAFPLNLSDEQQQRIREAAAQAPVTDAKVQPADLLPAAIALRRLPDQVRQEIPVVANLGFVRTSDGILLVKSLDRIVVEYLPLPAK